MKKGFQFFATLAVSILLSSVLLSSVGFAKLTCKSTDGLVLKIDKAVWDASDVSLSLAADTYFSWSYFDCQSAAWTPGVTSVLSSQAVNCVAYPFSYIYGKVGGQEFTGQAKTTKLTSQEVQDSSGNVVETQIVIDIDGLVGTQAYTKKIVLSSLDSKLTCAE